MSHPRRPLCDARRIVGLGFRHVLGPAPWQLRTGTGALFSFCGPACLLSFVCSAAEHESSWGLLVGMQSTVASGTAG